MDKSIHYVAALRVWQMLSGGITLLLIPVWLNETSQGFYFVFSSIVGAQILFELGLSQVILQKIGAAFAMSKLSGNSPSTERTLDADVELASLSNFFQKWYLYASILFFCCVSSAGIGFLLLFARPDEAPQYTPILVILLFGVSIVLNQSGYLAMLEACGQMQRVASLRLKQSIVGYGVFWLGMAYFPTLWWMTAPVFAAAAISTLWIKQEKSSTSNALGLQSIGISTAQPIAWRQSIWPVQWRIALSWSAGYLMTQLFVPVCFAIYGAEKAGQLGLTLALFSAVFAIAFSWISAKSPQLVHFVAQGHHVIGFALFKKQARAMLFVAAAGCLGLTLLHWFVFSEGYAVSNRISEYSIFLALTSITMVNCFVSAAAAYMRAHQGEPMLKISIAYAVLTVLVLSFAKLLSLGSIMTILAILHAAIILPWTVFLLRGYHPSKWVQASKSNC